MDRLRIGLAGFGGWGKRHFLALKSNPRVHVVGVYDPKYRRRQGFFDSFQNLLNRSDAIDLVVPPHELAPMALEAIGKRKHVFVEKPMAITAAQAWKVANAAKRHDVIGCVGFIERFNPVFDALRILVRYRRPKLIFAQRSGNPTLVARETGALKDLAIHDIDLLRWIFGKPKRIQVDVHHSGKMAQIDLRFDGVEATVLADCLGPQKIRRWVVEGDGHDYTANFTADRWRLYEGNAELDVQWVPPLSLELGNFVKCVLNSLNPSPSLFEGASVLSLLEKAR